jgi:hypothetical protein
MAFNFL